MSKKVYQSDQEFWRAMKRYVSRLPRETEIKDPTVIQRELKELEPQVSESVSRGNLYEVRETVDFRSLYGYGKSNPKDQLPVDLAKAMSKAANGGLLRSSDAEAFVETLSKDHRTLQAEVMNFFLEVINEYGRQVGETDRTDPRNATIAETCKKIRDIHFAKNLYL